MDDAPDSLPTLFHGHGTRSMRVAWLLEELGVHYRKVVVPFPPRLLQPQFLAINPAGSLPFFVDGAVAMTESVAICLHLVEVYGPTLLTVAPGETGRAVFLQQCFYGEATLTQPLGAVLRHTRLEPPERRIGQVADDAKALFVRRLGAIERALAGADWATAGRFTVADISIGYALFFAVNLGLSDLLPVAVRDYADRLRARPAFRRATAGDPRLHEDRGDPT